MNGDELTVRGVRNFSWRSATEYDPSWEERTDDLTKIRQVWYVLTPFSTSWRGPAHSLVSFEFTDGEFLAISVEARRETGETYGILKGMLKRFEILYVAGDERDLVGMRAVHQGDSVYVYPARATEEGVRTLLLDMVEEANRLRSDPMSYHSLRVNCTTRLVDHVNRVAAVPIRWSWRILLPGYSDALAHRLGLLDTDLPLGEARRRWYVNERARRWIDAEDFSLRIRGTGDGETMDARPGG
ncbi:MAG: DUF4105 domain-containing protein [Gemmatimonadota bacterium]